MVFKNIPYAKPPVGELRWKRPVEMDPWEDVLDCTKFGNITVQDLPGNEQPWDQLNYKEFYADEEYLRNRSEDCLNLNIWVPAYDYVEKLPVDFWIHGGGFAGSYSSEMEFDGQAYAEKSVILVTIEYRCGALGFLAHPWLSAEDDLGISGNYGIYDQIAALNWVYENIAAFGGDPDNITVFGQSAGCMSTQILISSPLTEHKIARAILQSGVKIDSGIVATPSLKEAERFGERVVRIAGVKDLKEFRQLPAEDLLKAKALFDMENMIAASKNADAGAGWLRLVPNVDGHLLTSSVQDAFKTGNIKHIPYMAGCVQDDLGTTEQDRIAHSSGILLEECKTFCNGAAEISGKEAYCYLFARELPGEAEASDTAFHSAELWYTFGTLRRCWRPMQEHDFALSQKMVDAWTSFMKTGHPGNGWKPCSGDDRYVRVFS